MSDTVMWHLCDDGLKYPDHIRSRGSEAVIKELCKTAEGPEPGLIKIEPGNAYIEDPSGNQFAWNPHLSSWDEL